MKRPYRIRVFDLSLVVLPALATLLCATTGVVPLTEEEFEAVPAWRPDPEGVGEMPRVDLRDDLLRRS